MNVENILITNIRGTQYANKIRRTMFAIGKKYNIPKDEILKTAGRINMSIYNTLNKRLEDYKRSIQIMSGLNTEEIDDISILRRINIDIEGILEIENGKMEPKNFKIEIKYPVTIVITEDLDIPQEEQKQEDLDKIERTQEE